MKHRSNIYNRVSSFFFSLSITLGIYIALTELIVYGNNSNFYVFTFAVLLIYFAEIFTSFLRKTRKIQINLNFNDDFNELSEVFHKILLPIFLYISIVGFSYFNIENSSIFLVLIFTFFCFYILILNTKFFLFNEIKAESHTHYVYDVIKFLIFFLCANTLMNIYVSSKDNLQFLSIIIAGISFVINYLMLTRIKILNSNAIGLMAGSSLLTGLIFYLLNFLLIFNPLYSSLLLVFFFYISTAIIHHLIRKTLNRGVVLEYILVAILLIILTFFAI